MNRAGRLVLALVAVAGCGRGPSMSPPVLDAGVNDATTDAVGDQKESGLDSTSSDVMTDAVPSDSQGVGAGKPQWQDMPGDIGGCKVQRLTNPGDVRVYQWKPCDGIPGCERAEYDPKVVPPGGRMSPRGQVGYVNASIAVAQIMHAPNAYAGAAFISDEEGRAIDGYRSVENCGATNGSIGATGWGVSICYIDAVVSRCGGALSGPGRPSLLFNFPPEANGAPGHMVFGDTRWVWEWAMPFFLSSVSAVDGSDFRFLDYAGKGSVLEVAGPVSTGTHFLFNQYMSLAGGGKNERIAITDGLSEATPFIVPPDNEAHAMPGYAHSHIAWLRAINQQGEGPFEHIELWASPYTTDAASLKPEKVGDCESKYLPPDHQVAGYGYYALPQWIPGSDLKEVIWDLANKQSRSIPYPSGYGETMPAGMTKTHAWVMATKDGSPAAYLHRFAVK